MSPPEPLWLYLAKPKFFDQNARGAVVGRGDREYSCEAERFATVFHNCNGAFETVAFSLLMGQKRESEIGKFEMIAFTNPHSPICVWSALSTTVQSPTPWSR